MATAQSQASSSGFALAKLTGHDPISLDMFWNVSAATWSYSPGGSLSASHLPDWWAGGLGWGITRAYASLVHFGSTSFAATHEVDFKIHIPIFPDPRADTVVTLRGYSVGSTQCDFEWDWHWEPLGSHMHTYCQRQTLSR